MKRVEIKERKEAYSMGQAAYRWRGGELQGCFEKGGWERSMYHERFMSGEFHLCDPLDVDVIVVAPKPERPYDMTGGQVFDALEKDARARFENRRGHVARCDKDVQVVDTGAIYPFGEYGSHVDGWRKVEE